MRKLLYPFEALPALVALGFFWLLPRPVAHALGRRLGLLAYFISTRSRRTALENLRQRLGLEGKAAVRVAQASLMQAGAAIMDMLRGPRLKARSVERDLAIPAATRAAMDEIRKGGAGAVLACAHFGNWEYVSLAWPLLGMPETVFVARPPRHAFFRWMFEAVRSGTGTRVIHRTGAVRYCLDLVRRGGMAYLMFDLPVPPQARAEPMDFFGVPTYTATSPAYIALETGAPFYLTYSLPLGMHRYRLILERIEPPAGAHGSEAIHALMQEACLRLETAIRGYPEAWAWWIKRWNIRPEGSPREEWPAYSRHEKSYEGKRFLD